MMTSRNRTSGLPQITQPFKEIRDAEGVVRPIIGSHPFFFPLFPILVKSSPPQSHFLQKTPFVPFPSTLFFFLPCSFSYFILYPSKRNFLSNITDGLSSRHHNLHSLEVVPLYLEIRNLAVSLGSGNLAMSEKVLDGSQPSISIKQLSSHRVS